MHRSRRRLAATLLTALAALAGVTTASATTTSATATATATATVAPSPDAPHRSTVVTGLHDPEHDPGHHPGHDAGREKAARVFAEGRRAQAEAARHQHLMPGHGTAAARADVTHNWWGVFPQPGTHDGIMATHSVDAGYKVSNADNFTYAPTTKAQNSCMEVVTAYWSSGNEIWAWDWCSSPGGPARTLPVNADFLATYTTTATGRPAYTVQMVQDDPAANRWSAYLYNYRASAWDLLFRQSGRDQSGLDHGWDMFEIYASVNPATGNGYYCDEARTTVFDSGSVQLRAAGSWKPARPADSPWTDTHPDGSAFLCPALKFLQAGANDHWTVRQ
ncbi:carbohydrate-binding protein [Streptomyces gamaensis]|uniref:Carbohydrate-binding protein n=1 Tax=Streptomyces gamaensis TaxID=1763542 RepID=A0ABW0ZC17_9ACTN